ncbi:hypothetical protein POX_c04608 [Penicillium oxalicum]|uniref:hypothetical protein n=1 Tax=Penicillium oxalicum TaxID=69781 RepID=UPI0020B8BC3B|nr:hypothetical protein POX_c04608 [Penicillium oxalicum]KAI2791732.1 hypothetical protein POX_c04608 [Penicillium oxalicum]
MSKHYRSFKCHEPGCDTIRSFTYSGGLLGHQRNVHKKNNDSKKPLMCSYAGYDRSTGSGFTRKDNLWEHLRRRHRHTNEGPTASTLKDMLWERANSGLKRKQDSPNGKLLDFDKNGHDLRNEVERLRREKAIRQLSMPEHDPQFTQAMPSSAQYPGS